MAAAVVVTAPANAQFLADQRVQIVDYVADTVVPIAGQAGQQTAIELAADEAIQTVAIGDSAAWSVNVDKSRRQLFVKPAQSGAETNMTVVTNARRYLFALGSGAGGAPYVLRFRYGARDVAPPPDLNALLGRYRVSGVRALQPRTMFDDGVHTFVEWPADVALPAVFSIDRLGRESVLNGAMRGQYYVLDSVSDRLIFRIDANVASAQRTLPKRRPAR